MPTVKKIIQKMRTQPHGIRINEAEKALAHYGYSFSRQKGSHRHYIDNTGDVITLKDPLKAAYISEILKRIDRKEGK